MIFIKDMFDSGDNVTNNGLHFSLFMIYTTL